MEQDELLRFAVGVLERLRFPYFVTGSIATIFYGEPRFTNDIDIVVDLAPERVGELCRAFPVGTSTCRTSRACSAFPERSSTPSTSRTGLRGSVWRRSGGRCALTASDRIAA